MKLNIEHNTHYRYAQPVQRSIAQPVDLHRVTGAEIADFTG